ncbi:hypothetical protein C8R47DRAFT_1283741 [Mycena vitilis]|nr:hypothetical protein C8R47DRAFT_1283741 [Mycena vitilis]
MDELLHISQPQLCDRLRYNVSALGEERTTIAASVTKARALLADMQARQPTLDDHDTQIALRRYLADYSSLLAPIRLLPVDILQMIFLHPDMHDLEQMGAQVVTEFDTEGVTAVCHHQWRDVALGIPQLWSSFQVTLGHGRYSSLEWTRLRLERSKTAPLTVCFHWRPIRKVDPADQPRHMKAVEENVGELVGHAERWHPGVYGVLIYHMVGNVPLAMIHQSLQL